nr:hypothetical protein [Tanacetum cinerariifolium]
MSHTNLSQQQSGNFQQPPQEIQEEEAEREPVLTPTSKKPGSRGKRVKSMAKKTLTQNRKPKSSEFENFEAKTKSCFWPNVSFKYPNMLQQQLEIKRKEKMKRIDREVNPRVALNDSKRVVEDLKVLQISTDGMDPIDAAIVNAQKA